MNEAEYDVKNYADRGGACHQLGTAYIGFQIWQPCVGCEDLAAGQTIRNSDILLNSIEKKQDFKLPLWPLPISIPCFYLNHFGEKGLTTK